MKQLVSDHFAVFIVLAVFLCLFTAYMIEVTWHPGVSGTIDWLEGEMKEVIGAILMGLTASVRKLLDKPEVPAEPK